jgi:hypothetical protein
MNDRVSNLYNALTGDNITEKFSKSFQRRLKRLADLRNAAVHRGTIWKKQEAENSLKTATELVKYFKQ